MRGIRGATAAVADYLAAALPAKVAALEDRLEYPAGTFPPPALVTTQEQPRLDGDAWPAVFVAGQDTTSIDVDEYLDDGGTRYRITYRLRVLCFVRGEGFADTTRRRDDFTLAVRELLLEAVRLDDHADEPAEVDPTSIAESYSDVGTTEARASIAASYVDVSVIMEETLAAPTGPTGTVGTVTIHPALLDD